MRRALALILLTATTACGSSGPAPASSGAELPALSVRSLTAGAAETTLDAVTDAPMVLNLWAPWCPPCRAEMPDFDTVARAHPDVTFVGLATGTEEAAAADFATEVGVSYGLYYDLDDEALSALGVTSLPSTLFVDETGRIVATHLGALTAPALETQLSDHFGDGDGG